MGTKFLIFFFSVSINQTCWTAADSDCSIVVGFCYQSNVGAWTQCREVCWGWVSASHPAAISIQIFIMIDTLFLSKTIRENFQSFMCQSAVTCEWISSFFTHVTLQQSNPLCCVILTTGRLWSWETPDHGIGEYWFTEKGWITKDISCSSLGFPQSCTFFSGWFQCWHI